MSSLREAAPGLRFERMRAAPEASFARPARYEFIEGLARVPLSDSEIFKAAAGLPLAVAQSETGLVVVGLLAARFTRQPLCDARGQWAGPYMPLAIRCMPFWRQPTGLVALATGYAPRDEAIPYLDASLRPTAAFMEAVRLLDGLGDGAARLSASAVLLRDAGLLAPLVALTPGAPMSAVEGLLTVHPSRLGQVSNDGSAQLVSRGLGPVDLATALYFSQSQLARSLAVEADEMEALPVPLAPAMNDPLAAPDLSGLDYGIDTSPLFSFEEFRRGQAEDG